MFDVWEIDDRFELKNDDEKHKETKFDKPPLGTNSYPLNFYLFIFPKYFNVENSTSYSRFRN